ncbi:MULTISPECIES: type IV pilus modification PilV family protein [Geobacillus]|uniref:General secretion pathway protein J n=1 Tax=Geobacillus thermocatenulatus TaxID=33938 RepID=A0A226QAP1_9BACL|nr:MULTISPECIES: type II secretion system protein [Geobacillus]KPD01578.1 hypothetical protein LR69_00193 [Geobacillus sp. BCO2]RAN22572.1 General secretion pathway protein J [Geobacillus sp. A8]ASS98682.1 general secretion pathway protein J [Geobacillus thermocatenulatus]KLR73939.1 General secretion pathway protein J [Geobacillus sp. T6]OXB89435.1 general secretion pathway protein J [Geobacillus thermocatenulatus]
MAEKNFASSHPKGGFTLIETLLSVALLSAVAIGLFSFFTNAMNYTADNEQRTVAIHLARGTASYFEKNVRFASLANYMANSGTSFLKVDETSCSQTELLNLLFSRGNESGTISVQEACAAQLSPKVNDVPYATTIYVIRSDQQGWDSFLRSSEFQSFPDQLKDAIRTERTRVVSSDAGRYMMKIYAIVRYGEKTREMTWVEGVITDETIR